MSEPRDRKGPERGTDEPERKVARVDAEVRSPDASEPDPEEAKPARRKKAEPELPWIESTWKNLPKYQCRFCSWDTTDLDRMKDHAETFHGPGRPMRRDTGLVDERGRRIIAVEKKEE